MSDVKALIAEARDPGRALSAQEWSMLALRLAEALEASVQAPENADYLFENPEPVAVPPEFFERLAQVTEAPEPVRAPAVDREALGDIIRPHIAAEYMQGQTYPSDEAVLDEIFASGILLDAAEVEARGLEKANAIAERVAEGAEQRRNADPTDAEYWEGFRRGARSVAHSVSARAQQVREGKA